MEKTLQLSSSFEIFLITGLCLFLYMLAWFFYSLFTKKRDQADIAWGGGFILVAWVSFVLSGYSLYGALVNVLVTFWGARLSIHLYLRNRKRKEDFRYEKWKSKSEVFFKVFVLQGVLLYIIALPILWIQIHHIQATWNYFFLGAPLWAVGFVLETVADYTLSDFMKNPANKGKLLTTGVWGYIRHPNYLGEIIQWWAIWVMTLSLPLSYLFLVSPVLITFLIFKVSGIAPLEKKMELNPDFKSYVEKTFALIPPAIVNWLIYILVSSVLIIYGPNLPLLYSILIAIGGYLSQTVFLYEFRRKIVVSCVLLSTYALITGLAQETLFIHLNILSYPHSHSFPPFWLLSLYPLFALAFDSLFSFLNRSLYIAFFAGGIGASLAYISGQKLGSVYLFPPLVYPLLFVSWGLYLIFLVLFNRWIQSRLFSV